MSANGKILWTSVGIAVVILGCGLVKAAYPFAGGTGEPNNPYQIATAADLLAIGSDLDLCGKCYVLTRDIDLDPNLPGGRVFDDALIARDTDPTPEGTRSVGFSGVVDGQGHTIWHLCLSGQYGRAAGLFGSFGGFVKDLHLKEVRASGAPCGALAGVSNHGSMILRCSVTGQVTGAHYIGGLVGGAFSPMILQCEAQADVSGDADAVAGGLVGSTYGTSGQILECRAVGTVLGGRSAGGLFGSSGDTAILRCAALSQVTAREAAGGLIGTGPNGGQIVDCYARGTVTGSTAGGLIGAFESVGMSGTRVLNSYAAGEVLGLSQGATTPLVGGLFGTKRWIGAVPLVLGCFWDTQLSQTLAGVGSGPFGYGTGLTTAQMQQQDTFQRAGWDFGSTWVMSENDYPALRWEPAQEASQP